MHEHWNGLKSEYVTIFMEEGSSFWNRVPSSSWQRLGVWLCVCAVFTIETCSGFFCPLKPTLICFCLLKPTLMCLTCPFLGPLRAYIWATAYAHCDSQPSIPALSLYLQHSPSHWVRLHGCVHTQRSLMSAPPFFGLQLQHWLWNPTYRSIIACYVFLALTFFSNFSCFPDISSWISRRHFTFNLATPTTQNSSLPIHSLLPPVFTSEPS